MPEGYCLRFTINPDLSARGLVATNAPGDFTKGSVAITFVNCGREIVEVNHGNIIGTCWLDKKISFEWETNEN